MNGARIVAASLVAIVFGVIVVFPLAILCTVLSFTTQLVERVFDAIVPAGERVLDRISGI